MDKIRKIKMFLDISIIYIVLSLVFQSFVNIKNSENYININDEVIRFHVRANSDTDIDQNLKLSVKNKVVSYLKPILKNSDSKEKSEILINQNLDNITQIANEVLKQNNSNYEVNTYMTREYFPMKMYGDLIFPMGEYEALRIDIGKAKGKNWWCVIYPSLCFIDDTHSKIDDNDREKIIVKFKLYEEIKGFLGKFKLNDKN